MKSPRLRWYGHNVRMNVERMPKQIVNARMDWTKKRGWPQKWWTDEAEEDLKIIRNLHAVTRDWAEWRKIVLEAKAYNGLHSSRRRERRRRRKLMLWDATGSLWTLRNFFKWCKCVAFEETWNISEVIGMSSTSYPDSESRK